MLRSLVGVGLLAAAVPAFASSTSAPLAVSVTVVRSCAVQTGADLTLRCSTSAGQPRISDARTSQPSAPPVTSASAPSSDTRLVTINF